MPIKSTRLKRLEAVAKRSPEGVMSLPYALQEQDVQQKTRFQAILTAVCDKTVQSFATPTNRIHWQDLNSDNFPEYEFVRDGKLFEFSPGVHSFKILPDQKNFLQGGKTSILVGDTKYPDSQFFHEYVSRNAQALQGASLRKKKGSDSS